MRQWLSETFKPDGVFDRDSYRMISLLLLGVMTALFVATGEDGQLPLRSAFVAMAIDALLLLTTIRRLRDAGRSMFWLTFMIVTIHAGPTWQPSPAIKLQASDLLTLIPVIVGCLAGSARRAVPVSA